MATIAFDQGRKKPRPGPVLTGQSGQEFFKPGLVDSLSGGLGGMLNELMPMFLSYIQDPTASPLFQNQLEGLLESLVPSENAARSSMTDAFRAAGGLRGGAYGQGLGNLEAELMRNRQGMASSLLGQSFGQMTGAMGQQLSQLNPLLEALKMNQSQQFGFPPQGQQDQNQPLFSRGGRGSTFGIPF